MKTRLHLKALVLTLGISCIPFAKAGVPVVEATNIIYSPLEYMQIAEQTVNTIQQIENQIMMYMNQIKQIEQAAQNLKGALDFKDIQSISDLQYRIGRLKNAYKQQIDSYNNLAKATNSYMNFTCDWVNLYVNCTEEQAKRAKDVEEAKEEIVKSFEDIQKDFFNQAKEDGNKIKEMGEKIINKHDDKKDGINQSIMNGNLILIGVGQQLVTNQSYTNKLLENLSSTTMQLHAIEQRREKAKEVLKKLRQKRPKFLDQPSDDNN